MDPNRRRPRPEAAPIIADRAAPSGLEAAALTGGTKRIQAVGSSTANDGRYRRRPEAKASGLRIDRGEQIRSTARVCSTGVWTIGRNASLCRAAKVVPVGSMPIVPARQADDRGGGPRHGRKVSLTDAACEAGRATSVNVRARRLPRSILTSNGRCLRTARRRDARLAIAVSEEQHQLPRQPVRPRTSLAGAALGP
jgi:hypothetical protein